MTSPHTTTSQSLLADRFRVLLDIARTQTGTLGTEELFRSIHQETARVLEASGFYISLYDPDEDLATVVFYVDQGRKERVSVQYRGSESEVIRSGEASMVQDRNRIESLLVLGEDEGRTTRSAISAPLRFKGRVIGAISAESYEVGGYCRDDMEREVAAARRGRSLAAVIFDLDHFKEINDALGHVAGDRILERVARILEDETRSMNLVARYGGDEFVSVLSDSDLEGARIHAQRVAKRVKEDPELEVHDVTISVGVATFDPGMDGPDALIRAADEDLYREKDSRPPTERPDKSG